MANPNRSTKLTRVAIVGKDYDLFTETLARTCEHEESSGKPVLDVRVVRNTREALAWVGTLLGVVFYVGDGKDREAERTKNSHPSLTVVVLKHTMPSSDVCYLDAGWLEVEKVCAGIARNY